jgi:hypothetical protein
MTTSYERRAQAEREEDVRRAQAGYEAQHARQGFASGVTILAGVLAILAGLWDIIIGVEALRQLGFFIATPHYLYNIDTTNWGWIHVGIGAALFVVGCCLAARMTWARFAGIFIAMVSIVMNFLFVTHYPFWSILLIGLDILVIWAFANARRPADRY